MIRRLQLLVIAVILLIAAFSTELDFLFYLVYLAILVVGGSYILTRLGLADLEAGYAVNQLTGHVGDRLQITYTLRNTSRMPKPWLEIHNPTTLPGGLPGRAITLGSRSRAVVARPGAARPARPLPGRAAPDPDRRPVRLLRGVGVRRPGRRGRRLPADRQAAAVAAAGGERRGQPLRAGADAPDLAPRDRGPAVRAGRQLQPDPLALDRPPRRDPGQGVRARADGRRLDLPRPRAIRAGRPRRRIDGRDGRPRGGLDRRQGPAREPRRRDDGQRPSPGHRPGRPRRPAAPEDHAAARRGRRGRHDAARRVADRRRRPAPPRDDRDHHHAVDRPRLDPARSRRCGRAGSRRWSSPSTPRPPSGWTARPGAASARPSPSRRPRPRSSEPSGRGRSATPSPSTS